MIPRGPTLPVGVALASGLALGAACHAWPDAPVLRLAAAGLAGAAELFLQGVRLATAPLVFFSIVAGLAGMDGPAALGRIGTRAAAWLAAAAAAALAAGGAAAWLVPGVALAGAGAGPVPASMGSLAPVLPVAVCAVACGLALAAMRGVLSDALPALAEEATIVLLGLARQLARLSPLAAFAATAAVTARHGLAAVALEGGLVAGGMLACAGAAALLGVMGWAVLGRAVWPLLADLRLALATGFVTASSEQAYPRLIEALDEHGVPSRVSGMVLPLGFAFGPCGALAYLGFATVFLAHAYAVPLDTLAWAAAPALGWTLARGFAGVPLAALAASATLLPALGLPAEATLLLLGIDAFVDFGRSAANVLGHGLAAAAVARWAEHPARRPIPASLSPHRGR